MQFVSVYSQLNQVPHIFFGGDLHNQSQPFPNHLKTLLVTRIPTMELLWHVLRRVHGNLVRLSESTTLSAIGSAIVTLFLGMSKTWGWFL